MTDVGQLEQAAFQHQQQQQGAMCRSGIADMHDLGGIPLQPTLYGEWEPALK